jgi:hypothetical protein
LHRGLADPNTGRCIDTCDPNKALLHGRAFDVPRDAEIPAFDGPGTFINPLMQFVVWRGKKPTVRDTTFTFHVDNGFRPLLVNLAATTFIQPQNMRVVPQTGELALADGSAQGLLLVDLGRLGVSRSYF